MKSVFLLACLIAGANMSFATLVPLGAVPTTGSGFGAINTVLTFTSPANSSTEIGCVGGGIAGALVKGAGACAAGFSGGNEQAENHTYSALSLGLGNFADLQIIFNPSEPGSSKGSSITLDDMALTLWNPATGALLGSFKIAAPYVLANADPGTGKAGFGFVLDSAQTHEANLILDTTPSLYLGISAKASNAEGSHETISIRTTGLTPRDIPQVPEPSTIGLLSAGLGCLALLRCRRA